MNFRDLNFRRVLTAVLAAVIGVAMIAYIDRMATRAGADSFTLAGIEADVTSRWPEVAQLPAADLEARIKAGRVPLLFDVREDGEYHVSHLQGAERVDPKTEPASLATRFGDKVRGRDVVFYCSVGMRSSNLAAEAQDALMKAGATAVYNLQGGIFGWHNERRALVDANGPTDFVHPYDKKWGTLVARQYQTRMYAKP